MATPMPRRKRSACSGASASSMRCRCSGFRRSTLLRYHELRRALLVRAIKIVLATFLKEVIAICRRDRVHDANQDQGQPHVEPRKVVLAGRRRIVRDDEPPISHAGDGGGRI